MMPENWIQLTDDLGTTTGYFPAEGVTSMQLCEEACCENTDHLHQFKLVLKSAGCLGGMFLWYRTVEKAQSHMQYVAETANAAQGNRATRWPLSAPILRSLSCPAHRERHPLGRGEMWARQGKPCPPECPGCQGRADRYGWFVSNTGEST